jgi:hypothetical protein
VGSDDIAGAYADLLQRERWQWFCTLTFAGEHRLSTGGMLPEKADKAFRWFLRRINESLYGNRWMRTPHGGVIWARGTEAHRNGRPHFHAVLAAPDRDLNTNLQRYAWHELWYREFGRNRIEQPFNQEEVAGYVSKYVTKEGEIDFSHNFGKQMPPALEFPANRDDGSELLKPSLGETRIGRPRGDPVRPAPGAGLSLTLPVRPLIPRFKNDPNDNDDRPKRERDESWQPSK